MFQKDSANSSLITSQKNWDSSIVTQIEKSTYNRICLREATLRNFINRINRIRMNTIKSNY